MHKIRLNDNQLKRIIKEAVFVDRNLADLQREWGVVRLALVLAMFHKSKLESKKFSMEERHIYGIYRLHKRSEIDNFEHLELEHIFEMEKDKFGMLTVFKINENVLSEIKCEEGSRFLELDARDFFNIHDLMLKIFRFIGSNHLFYVATCARGYSEIISDFLQDIYSQILAEEKDRSIKTGIKLQTPEEYTEEIYREAMRFQGIEIEEIGEQCDCECGIFGFCEECSEGFCEECSYEKMLAERTGK